MLTLQIYLDGCWHDAAVLDFKEPLKGRDGEALLAYDFNYAVDHLDRNDIASCSINYPVMLIGSHFAKPWFGFLDDIIPAGASRRYWITQLGLQGKSANEQDYTLLKAGTIAPVGNLRIKESLPQLPPVSQLKSRRFPAEWAIERDTDFLEYARQAVVQRAQAVKRYMLNIVFGNSDNHGRNSAILKKADGMWLAPVYDFAPMKADPEGVVRTTQWGSPYEEGGHYQWHLIAQQLHDLVSADVLLQELSGLANKLKGLKARLAARGVPPSILEMPGIGFNYLDERIAGWQL